MSEQSHRVLVVDDEPNIVDVISMALRYQGFDVAEAGTGAEALSQVRAFRPHLILLDVMLPDMEGFDVAQRLGAQRAEVPIIFLTARDSTEDKVSGLRKYLDAPGPPVIHTVRGVGYALRTARN